MKIYPIKKYLYIILGSVSLGLGIVGVFLPVLPTTPFLLLASLCYLRSSERMYNWMINHKIFGAYIYSYLTYKAIPRKTKIIALIFLWTTLIVSIIFISSLYIRLLLVGVGIGVSVHLVILKTLSCEQIKELNELIVTKSKETII